MPAVVYVPVETPVEKTVEKTVEKDKIVYAYLQTVSSEESRLVGEWSSASYNTYTTYNYKIGANSISTGSYGVHNTDVYVRKVSDTKGYIYYRFSSDITGYGPAPTYTPFTVNSTGKWGVLAYQNLTSTTVQMCDFYDSTYDFPETLEACVTKYTDDNVYFASLSTMDHSKN